MHMILTSTSSSLIFKKAFDSIKTARITSEFWDKQKGRTAREIT